MALGKTFSFDEAKQIGLVNEVFENAGFMDRVMDYARQFCPPNKASMAVGHIKRSVQTGSEIPIESALALERELQSLLFKSKDAKEGLAANVEKRTPKFGGR
jgi:enoyl-CoA hydratase/carnithine racemase